MSKVIKLVTFDIVNTILKVHRSPGYQYSLVANKNGVNIPPESIDNVYKEVWKAKKAEHPTYGLHHGVTSKSWWEDFVYRVFIRSGYAGDDMELLKGISTQIWHHYKTAEGCWDILPHSISVLQEVRAQGYSTCVISNFDERLTDTLRVLRLNHLFDFVVTCMDAKCSKPDKDIYLYTLRQAGVSPCQALHVGDSVQEDFWAASGVGMEGVILDKERTLTEDQLKAVPRDRVIHDLRDLVCLLQSMKAL